MAQIHVSGRLLIHWLVVTLLSAAGAQVLMSQDSSQSHQEDVKLSFRISVLKSTIASGETLQLRLEVRNEGASGDLYVCKDFENDSPLCSVEFSIENAAGKFGPSAGIAGDFNPWHKEPLEKALARDWIAVRPAHFYGTTIFLDPRTYPRLKIPGTYRVLGTYSSRGVLGYQGSVLADPEEVTHLPARLWRGQVDSNAVVIHVIPKKN